MQQVEKAMLTPEGFDVLRMRKGTSEMSDVGHLTYIHYDVHYVIEKLEIQFLDPLGFSLEEFIDWLNETHIIIVNKELAMTEDDADIVEADMAHAEDDADIVEEGEDDDLLY